MQAKLSRALALHQTADWADAAKVYDAVLRAAPRHPEALRLRAQLAAQMGDRVGAARLGRRAIAAAPGASGAHLMLASVLADLGQHDAALHHADQAVALRPTDAAAHLARGNALAALQRLDGACISFARACELSPADPRPCYNCAVAHAGLARWGPALGWLEAALRLSPVLAEAHVLRGNILMRLARPAEALASYESAIAHDGNNLDAHNNRASALRELGRDNEAIAGYQHVVARQPGFAAAQWNLAVAFLSLGNTEAGWRGYEWRHRLAGGPPLSGPARRQWRGQPALRGRSILVQCEQGFGDSLQFSRYLLLLQDRGARVHFAVQPPLVALMTRWFPGVSVFAEDHRPDRVDYFCPLLSLPLGFGTTLATVPPIPDGLAADPARSAIWARRLGNERRPRIGIAWSGNPSHISDHHRSIPLELWRDLLTFDAQWISIQKDLRPSDAHALSASGRVADFADDLVDFEDTAALIAQLDLVIAVDTSSAHLAAILGKPVWLLLAATPDWRWLRDRADSPWYKSVQLFRQEIHGNWAPVFADIKRRLQAAR